MTTQRAAGARGFDAQGSVYQIRWREAWHTLVYLYRHPYNTTQIAQVIEALQGRSLPRLLRRLQRRPAGQALLAAHPSLRAALSDRAWLEQQPPGSLGHAYVEYCRGEGLSAGMTGFIDEGTSAERTRRLPPQEAFIQDFLFHSHDIYHLVTGYKTDLIGEICLLAFTAAQTRNTGVVAMTCLGLYALRLPRLHGQRMALRAAVRGLRAAWLPEQNWVDMMALPLHEVQKRLGLYPPPEYVPLYVGRGKSQRRLRKSGRPADQVSPL